MLCNSAVEYAVRMVQANQEELQLNGNPQFLVYVGRKLKF